MELFDVELTLVLFCCANDRIVIIDMNIKNKITDILNITIEKFIILVANLI